MPSRSQSEKLRSGPLCRARRLRGFTGQTAPTVRSRPALVAYRARAGRCAEADGFARSRPCPGMPAVREAGRSEDQKVRRSRGQVAKRSEDQKIRRSGYGESQKAGRTSFRTAPVSPPAQHSATSETLQACASSCDPQTPGTLPGTASAKPPHRKRLERKRRRPEYEKRRIVRKMPLRRTNAGGGCRRAPSQPRSTNRRLAVRFGRRDVGTEPVGHTGRIGVHWCIRAHPAHETKKRKNFPVVFNSVAEENPIFVFGGRFTRLIYGRRTGIRGTRNAYDALC